MTWGERDIGAALLEDLKLFDFEAVRPRLNISFETDTAKKTAENRQFEVDYDIDYNAVEKWRVKSPAANQAAEKFLMTSRKPIWNAARRRKTKTTHTA